MVSHFVEGRAIDYRSVIDNFVAKMKNWDVRDSLALSETDWDSIILVAGWLKSFRTATTLMSTTKRPMLSYTHTIFLGLQDDLRKTIRQLPTSTPSVLRNGLLDAHRKLSDYYYKFDQSPYYTWAACTLIFSFLSHWQKIVLTCSITVLDPRISYDRLKSDFEHDPDLLEHLEDCRTRLHDHFQLYYANKHSGVRHPPAPLSSASMTRPKGSPQKDFTSRYRYQSRAAIDELHEYFKLPGEDFDLCDPVQWWFGR